MRKNEETNKLQINHNSQKEKQLDYKLAEELSDMIWHDFDKWNKKVRYTVGYQIIRSSSNFYVPRTGTFGHWNLFVIWCL